MSTTLEWMRGTDQKWPDLSRLDLENSVFDNAEGVYIVWHGGTQPEIVAIGQGKIRERLKAELKDQNVRNFEKFKLYVAWAPAEQNERPGIEKYLAGKLSPQVDRHVPEGEAITVNLPWKKG